MNAVINQPVVTQIDMNRLHDCKGQEERVLYWFANVSESIEPMQALNHLGIYRLAAVINQLGNKGHNILSERETSQNRFGENCKYAKYTYQGFQSQVASKGEPVSVTEGDNSVKIAEPTVSVDLSSQASFPFRK